MHMGESKSNQNTCHIIYLCAFISSIKHYASNIVWSVTDHVQWGTTSVMYILHISVSVMDFKMSSCNIHCKPICIMNQQMHNWSTIYYAAPTHSDVIFRELVVSTCYVPEVFECSIYSHNTVLPKIPWQNNFIIARKTNIFNDLNIDNKTYVKF